MKTREKSIRTAAFGIAWLAAALFLEPTANATTGGRFALLIGNGDYKDGTLISGRANAEALGPVLEQIGFEVRTVPDANLKLMTDELKDFGDKIGGASAVLFFYSGHGFQRDGESYLLPVGGSSLRLKTVLNTLALASGAVKLMLLDACRSKEGILASEEGWSKPQAGPENLVQGFATLPGAVAIAEGPLSPYTKALVGRFRQPGIDLKQFFTDVHHDVIEDSSHGQHPQYPTTEGLDGADDTFLLSPPATVKPIVTVADDDLVVLLNGDLVLNHQTQGAIPQGTIPRENTPPERLTLKSGDNKLTVLVSNHRTLRNGLAWERANGWGYSLQLFGPDGRELESPECAQTPCFSGGEDNPFKNGPHHGKTFVVATAELYVDPTSGMSPRVSLQKVKTDYWKDSDTPFWAKDQQLLYAVSLTKLPLGIEVVGDVKAFFEVIVKSVLKVRVNVPDPDKVYSIVRGNVALKELVVYCMDSPQWHGARTIDFEEGLRAARDGQPKPFDGFVKSLNDCIRDRAEGRPGLPVSGEDLQVSTAFEDWTQEPIQPETSGSSFDGQPRSSSSHSLR